MSTSLHSVAMRVLRVGCGVVAIGLAGIAHAADTPGSAAQATADSGGIGEIIVTAQKRTEKAQNVPVAITSLTGRQLAATGVADTVDLKLVTPGLQVNTNLGGFGQPRIRGIGSTATGPGIENPVATIIDGVYLASQNGAIMQLNDIGQVDVLKGPQGTLFGRNATGGVIQITTRDPGQKPEGAFEATYGNYRTWGVNGTASGGLSDTLSASIAGTYKEQDKGYGLNLANGQEVGKDRTGAARVKLVWKPDAATKVVLSADYGEVKGDEPVIRTVSDWIFSGTAQPGGFHDIDNNHQPYLHTQIGGAGLNIHHDFGAVALTAISAYRSAFFHTAIDADQTPRELLSVDITQTDRQFSQELQLTSNAGGPFKWVAGLYFLDYHGHYQPSVTSGAYLCGYGDAAIPGCTNAVADSYDDASLKSYAGFVQGTYALDRATNLTIGARFTYDQRSLHDWSTFSPFPNVVYPSNNETSSANYPKATWRIALDHRFSPELMAYATYNRGFKSGTFQPDTFNPTVALKVETVDAFEAGFKADLFNRALRFNVSGFYYDYDNLQANFISNGVLAVYDAPGSINYGIDADVMARPTRNFQITAGLSWLHARYKQGFDDAFLPVAGSGPFGLQFYQGNASDSHLQDTPDFTANLGASYDIDSAIGRFTLAGNLYHNGGYYGDPGNLLHQSAYTLLNGSLTWRDSHDHFSIRVWGKNLTDAQYTEQYDQTNFGNNIVPAPPRTFGVTLGAAF